MKWKKHGLVYRVESNLSWHQHSALQPTPILLNTATIRVFVGFRDSAGASRVGFVDLNASDPTRVTGVTKEPALNVGAAGMFDEDGVVPCAIVRRGADLFLYYAGYQQGRNVKFCVFGGLAISKDEGRTFARYSRVPIMDRSDSEPYFRVIHSALLVEDKWKIWYGGGDRFSGADTKQFPNYDIRYTESEDGINMSENSSVVIPTSGDEYRVGRPFVVKREDKYQMFFCAGTETTGYRLAYAESADGARWIRDDAKLGISVSETGWDSRMQAYPSIMRIADKTYLFYNGNEYGREGFGVAELTSD